MYFYIDLYTCPFFAKAVNWDISDRTAGTCTYEVDQEVAGLDLPEGSLSATYLSCSDVLCCVPNDVTSCCQHTSRRSRTVCQLLELASVVMPRSDVGRRALDNTSIEAQPLRNDFKYPTSSGQFLSLRNTIFPRRRQRYWLGSHAFPKQEFKYHPLEADSSEDLLSRRCSVK